MASKLVIPFPTGEHFNIWLPLKKRFNPYNRLNPKQFQKFLNYTSKLR